MSTARSNRYNYQTSYRGKLVDLRHTEEAQVAVGGLCREVPPPPFF